MKTDEIEQFFDEKSIFPQPLIENRLTNKIKIYVQIAPTYWKVAPALFISRTL